MTTFFQVLIWPLELFVFEFLSAMALSMWRRIHWTALTASLLLASRSYCSMPSLKPAFAASISSSSVSPRCWYCLIRDTTKRILACSKRIISSQSAPFSFTALSSSRSSPTPSNGVRQILARSSSICSFVRVHYLFVFHILSLLQRYLTTVGQSGNSEEPNAISSPLNSLAPFFSRSSIRKSPRLRSLWCEIMRRL